MKILLADRMSEQAIIALKQLGAEVVFKPDLSADDLPAAIKGVEILIVRSTRVKAEVIEAADTLSLIIRAGAGVNTIDLDSAGSRGIQVANCPGKNADAVAELAIGHLIAADRQIVNASVDLRAGKWRKKAYQRAVGLKGRTLGIIGLGVIGRAVARRARGLEMKVAAWSRSLTPEKAAALGIEYCADIMSLAERADAVSVHLAAGPGTRQLLGRDFFDRMKDGAVFINTSRGEIVDTKALREAIKTKKLRVGLDVFENEPAGGEDVFPDPELAGLINGTPHIGASTDQAAAAIAEEAVRIVKVYLETGTAPNTVNIRTGSPAVTNLVVRHYNRVGVMAGVLDALRNEGINIEEMNNQIFTGGTAASCTLKLDEKPSPATLEKISRIDNVIQISLK